ncbi:four-carbon acid sugar kinase family protein [Larkinella rosea]|nr:four-carbon acid sugar kinase family protein [Larkinella rosea]
MIAVIADDFTGAAELGGIGLSFGLEVEMAMSVDSRSTADLLVVATDTRSVSEEVAVQKVTEISEALAQLKPQLIYKKIDSVLRGHVVAETLAQLQVLDMPKALLIPANPALGRTLVNGQYFVNGKPIHQTHFANDPEFPVTESDVLMRFQDKSDAVFVRTQSEQLPDDGIVIGEVEKPADLVMWVNRVDQRTLVGGGSGFFSAVLASQFMPKTGLAKPVRWGKRWLYVCGSAFGEPVELVKKAASTGYSVYYLPEQLADFDDQDWVDWVTDLGTSLQQSKPVLLAIDPIRAQRSDALQLRTAMGQAVKAVFGKILVHELVIEGGSTASAVLQEIGITRLIPTEELATGVVRSIAIGKVDLHVTVKPGSYRWPTGLWPF